MSSENLISYWWMKEIYSQLPYHYRKNLKGGCARLLSLKCDQSPMQPYKDYGKSMPTCHCGLTCNLMTQLLKETIFWFIGIICVKAERVSR